MAFAVLQIARVVNVGVGASWTCAMHIGVVRVLRVATVLQPVGDALSH
jgi:hypothetical protein